MTIWTRPPTPLEIAPEAILARLVVDREHPMAQYAPHQLGVPAETTKLSSAAGSSIQLTSPLAVWASCMASDDVRTAMLALLGINGRAYFVVAVAVTELKTGEAAVSALEYVEVVKTPGGVKFDYETAPRSYCTCGRGAQNGTSSSDKVSDAVSTGFGAASTVGSVASTGLGLAGFRKAGVAKRSWAAAQQARIGSVGKGSWFSYCQRFGAKGGLPVLVLVAIGTMKEATKDQ
ncbi:hypothetical protein AURDEDRAFT_160910 [Auricularia subglabra TFB-10046 SS5]|nr:hypothetical protein AURDEDRAFT_160910 [Auricularia subglabra TFB-10046 SS5]